MHKKKIITFVFALVFSGAAFATNIQLNPNHPDRYVVVKGDTLWDISERFLQDPWLWPEIWYVNPQIDNPHLIYPGDIIRLVWVDGKPQLRLERGRPTVKLSPETRVERLPEAIPTIPLDAIQQFLTRPRVLGEGEFEAAPYVVQSAGERLITGAGDRVYVRGIAEDESAHQYTVVRKGEAYTDPKTGEFLGQEAMYVGDAVLQRQGDPSTLSLTATGREVVIGDRVLPAKDTPYDANFYPHAPEQEVDGQIISVVDGVSQIGSHQIVVLNRGEREGLEIGHVLAIYQRGETVPDSVTEDPDDTVTLPDERAGELIVFRTFEKVSYGLVVRAQTNMHVLDNVRNP